MDDGKISTSATSGWGWFGFGSSNSTSSGSTPIATPTPTPTPTPVQEVAQEIAQESFASTSKYVKRGDVLPHVQVLTTSQTFKVDMLGTENTFRELFEVVSSEMKCTADKIHFELFGKMIDASSGAMIMDRTIADGVKSISPWGIAAVGILKVHKY